ncbi:MAG: ATP-grasp domain-containing protein [Dehalococcoidia bacterium]|nr:ATP-grasp domain-containing protein [Dehalococcoidia bacterium]
MRTRVAIVYNEPHHSRYDAVGEGKAVLGVLEAVEAVHQALLELDFDVIRVPLVPPLGRAERKLRKLNAELVFNLFEGFCGSPDTEAVLPEIISKMGIPCTGCPASALKLGLDKAKMKVILTAAGIKTPDFQLLNLEILRMFRLGYPCIVKPRCEDASHGLSPGSVVTNSASLDRQIGLVSNWYGRDALVEKFIDGREFNATILGDSEYSVLPVSEIVYSLPAGMPKILTFAAKWEPDNLYFEGTKAICPAEVEAEERECIAKTAIAAFRIVGGKGYARVDMRMDHEGQVNVIEVNPNPDISPDSGAVRQAEAAGMTYTQFIEKIVQLALEGKDNGNRYSPYDSRRQTQHNENTAQYTRIQTL